MAAEAAVLRILPILLLIVIGVIIRRRQFLREDFAFQLSRLVLYITLPALIFTSFISASVSLGSLAFPLLAILFCFAVLVAGYAASKLFRNTPKMFPVSIATFEGGMFGYAFYSALFGAENLWRLVLFDMGNGLFFFTVIYYLIKTTRTLMCGQSTTRTLKSGKYSGETVSSPASSFASFLKMPIIIAILSGFLLSVSGLAAFFYSPSISFAAETLRLLGSATVPLIALSIGMQLRLPQTSLPLKLVLAKFAITVPIGLAFMLLAMSLLSADIAAAFPILFLALLPVSFSLPILMGERDKDRELVISSAIFSIPISIALIIVSVVVFGL